MQKLQEMEVRSLGWEYPLEKEIATHSSIPGLPCGSAGKESAFNAGDMGSIPGLGKSPGGGHGNPLQYSCLENPMDRGACWATDHRVTKSLTRLSDFTIGFPDSSVGKESACNAGDPVQFLGWEDPLEKG